MITNETKVILPTHSGTTYRKQDGEWRMAYEYGQYAFTLEAALRHMARHPYLFDQMMCYNPPLRQLIRTAGVAKAVGLVATFAPDNDALHKAMTAFAQRNADMQLADYDIQVLPLRWALRFFGHDGWQAAADKAKRVGHDHECYDLGEESAGPLHTGVLYEPYPCFDSYDTAAEDRRFCNYIIRQRPITPDDFRQLEAQQHEMNYCFVTEHLPSSLLPLVYHDTGQGFCLVAARQEDLEVDNIGQKRLMGYVI